MEEKETKKKGGKTLILILSILLLISIIFGIIMLVLYNSEVKKNNDIKALLNFYHNLNLTLNYTKEVTEALKEEWNSYIFDKKYSNITEMYSNLATNEKATIELMNIYLDLTEKSYKSIKDNNQTYVNNVKIKESVDEAYQNYKEYYNFVYENKELSYISLSLEGGKFELSNITNNTLLINILNL